MVVAIFEKIRVKLESEVWIPIKYPQVVHRRRRHLRFNSMENQTQSELQNCVIKPRINPEIRKEKVIIGCGAGFGGDRSLAALKLLQRVKQLDYLVLECLAERTLADRYHSMVSGGDGYDSRISEWMHLLLPLALERGTCIITNMGAIDPLGAQEKVLETATSLGINISVAVAHEIVISSSGAGYMPNKMNIMEDGISTYLGAAPIVQCLERYKPNVIITSRVADAALFLAPMVYELGWDWNKFELLAQGSLAGHLLECGCQLTGGYFMHPGDKFRDFPLHQLLDLSLPYAEVSVEGQVVVAKADCSGGVLNISTCAEQLLYEIGDPSAYITPDVVLDIRDVSFQTLSSSKVLCSGTKMSTQLVPHELLRLVPEDCGWKGWGEISYGGYACVKRAKAAEYLVRSWMNEVIPDVNDSILSYVIGMDSLKASSVDKSTSSSSSYEDIRLRMDGLFKKRDHAIQFTKEFTALYTNGPAGGGGISTGYKKEIILRKELVGRENVFWQTGVKHSSTTTPNNQEKERFKANQMNAYSLHEALSFSTIQESPPNISPAPSGQKISLFDVAHSRAGDKGNDINFSIIPHFPRDIERLKMIITPQWVKQVVSTLLNTSSFLDSDATTVGRNQCVDEHVKVEIYEVKGIHSLNVVVQNILDGGVNCSRRIDRHGKTISDLILCQQIMLPDP